jgi:hypothetical protein
MYIYLHRAIFDRLRQLIHFFERGGIAGRMPSSHGIPKDSVFGQLADVQREHYCRIDLPTCSCSLHHAPAERITPLSNAQPEDKFPTTIMKDIR